jgi:hypothetical protein
MVSQRSSAFAIIVLVPTPSVEATNTGSRIPANAPASTRPPKVPSFESTCRLNVDSTAAFMPRTAALPASMSTPAAAYAPADGAASPLAPMSRRNCMPSKATRATAS